MLLGVATLAGCGAGGSVNQDPLTHRLGVSATTVQRVASSVLNRSPTAGLDFGLYRALNRLTALAIGGRLDSAVMHGIDAAVHQPAKPYQAPDEALARLSTLATDARLAAIPKSATSQSSSSIRQFVADWNQYAGLLAVGPDEVAARIRHALSLRVPILDFLRRTQHAVRTHDPAPTESPRRDSALRLDE